MMLRRPIVAGRFYNSSRDALMREIEDCFLSGFGPGKAMTEDKKDVRDVRGAIVPHAGYMFSGPAAAHCYRQISLSGHYDVFVLLGFSHSGKGRGVSTILADWETPLGVARIDLHLAELMIAEEILSEDGAAHMHEHSIEVQIPFLQYVFGDGIRILPMSVSHDIDLADKGRKIAGFFEKMGKRPCFIASSDFTHYGPGYGFEPFGKNASGEIKKLDMGAMEKIKGLDPQGFLEYVQKTQATICGTSAIALLLEILKAKAKKAEVCSYYTSSDVTGGNEPNSVSYAGIVFE